MNFSYHSVFISQAQDIALIVFAAAYTGTREHTFPRAQWTPRTQIHESQLMQPRKHDLTRIVTPGMQPRSFGQSAPLHFRRSVRKLMLQTREDRQELEMETSSGICRR